MDVIDQIVDKETGCWNWGRPVDSFGYGIFNVRTDANKRGWRSERAHRWSWEIANGPIPARKCILHHCDNPACCNPDHLFLGSKSDNNKDRLSKGRYVGTQAAGEQNGNAKFTAEQVAKMKAERPGPTAAKRQYGISKRQYYRIINGVYWKAVN